jgi:thioredoxin reductase
MVSSLEIKLLQLSAAAIQLLKRLHSLQNLQAKLFLIHRRDSLRASKIMADRALNNPKIEMLWNTEVVDILGEEKVSGLSSEEHSHWRTLRA